jgi:hypothetical protein
MGSQDVGKSVNSHMHYGARRQPLGRTLSPPDRVPGIFGQITRQAFGRDQNRTWDPMIKSHLNGTNSQHLSSAKLARAEIARRRIGQQADLEVLCRYITSESIAATQSSPTRTYAFTNRFPPHQKSAAWIFWEMPPRVEMPMEGLSGMGKAR